MSAESTIPVKSPVTARSDPRDFLFHRAASIAKSRSGEKYLVKKPAGFLASFSVQPYRVCQPFTQAGDCVNLPATSKERLKYVGSFEVEHDQA
jgi:hypothetical protein